MAKDNLRFFENPAFHYIMIVMVFGTLILSSLSLYQIYRVQNFIIPKAFDVKSFLTKLTAHPEMKNFAEATPSNLVQITTANLGVLQAELSGLDISYLGNFLVQYKDRVVIYDYINDTIKAVVGIAPPLPQDLLSKLNKHSEMKSLQDQQPSGGFQLDATALAQLKSQAPSIYSNAQAGNYVLKYQSKIVVYDYDKDKIINVASIS